MNTHIDQTSERIRDVIQSIDKYSLSRIEKTQDYYDALFGLERFIDETIEPLHEEIYRVCNLFEDHFRNIYIYMDDATMEGHVTELETQLSQLRMVNEGLKSLPAEFNEEMGDLATKYYTMLNSLLDSRKMTKDQVCELVAVDDHLKHLERNLLLRPGFLHMKDLLTTVKEACIKLLSVFAMILGKWERKIEDRIDVDHLKDGMVMSNIEKGKTLSSKKGKKRQTNIYN